MENLITKKNFLENVIHEVETLKNLATKEEIAKLDFSTLNPETIDRCIYGQMTGNCRNERAQELISKACTLAVENDDEFLESIRLNEIKRNKLYQNDISKEAFYEFKFFSALETYIMLIDSENENIIQYLKGETQNLIL